jgi:hypothetical protein
VAKSPRISYATDGRSLIGPAPRNMVRINPEHQPALTAWVQFQIDTMGRMLDEENRLGTIVAVEDRIKRRMCIRMHIQVLESVKKCVSMPIEMHHWIEAAEFTDSMLADLDTNKRQMEIEFPANQPDVGGEV